MATWQWVSLAVVVLVPLLLMVGFHPARERLNARGTPMVRSWRPSAPTPPADDEHH